MHLRKSSLMEKNPLEPAPYDSNHELRLSTPQLALLEEALSLLLDVRSRALDIAAQVCRRQGSALPDVHDFQLPAVIDLQRRLAGARVPPDAMTPKPGLAAAATGRSGVPQRSHARAAGISSPVDLSS